MTRLSGEAVAETSGLCFERAGRRVLDGVSMKLPAGTVTLLAGPNGAGKSTLVRALSGGIRPHAGYVRVAGHDPGRDRRARAALGLVPQEIALYPRLTVRENLEIFAAFAGLRATRDQIDTCLTRTGLAGVAGSLVVTLSGGFQRRANVAAALVARPRLLLLDEPLVGLDPVARRAICADLKRLARIDGMAMLLVTHDLEDAESIADTVIVLKAGRIIAQDSPGELVARLFPRDSGRIELLLKEPPGEDTRHALARLGYGPTNEATVWRGVHRNGATASLDLAGVDVDELRYRRFRLDDAYETIVGEGHPA